MVVSCGAAGLDPRRVEQPLAVAGGEELRYTVVARMWGADTETLHVLRFARSDLDRDRNLSRGVSQ